MPVSAVGSAVVQAVGSAIVEAIGSAVVQAVSSAIVEAVESSVGSAPNTALSHRKHIGIASFRLGMRRRSFLRLGGVAMSGALATTGPATADRRVSSGRAQDAYEPLGSVAVPNSREAAVHHDGEVAYVAAGDGFAAVDITEPGNPTVLAERRPVETDTGDTLRKIWDCWPDGDRLVVAGPAQFELDAPTGFALFDISTPSQPEQVAYQPTNSYIHNCFFEDGIVYLTAGSLTGQPVAMVDVSDDDPTAVGQWSLLDDDPAWEAVAEGLRPPHDVYVQDDIAYVLFWEAGTWILDVADPADPAVLASIGNYTLEELARRGADQSSIEARIPPGNHHYAQVDDEGTLLGIGIESWAVEDEDGVLGEEGAVVGGPGYIELWDVSEKTAPEFRARIDAPESVDQRRSGWFTTPHNFDIVDDRLYSSWYYGGVKVHDVSEPANPTELAWWRQPDEAAFWTAQAAVPGEYFVASAANLGQVWEDGAETASGLYVFPDRAGTQADPPDLTALPERVTGDGTGDGTDDGGTGNGTAPDGSPGENATGNESDDSEGGDLAGPGLGVAAAVAGVGGGVALSRWLAGRHSGE